MLSAISKQTFPETLHNPTRFSFYLALHPSAGEARAEHRKKKITSHPARIERGCAEVLYLRHPVDQECMEVLLEFDGHAIAVVDGRGRATPSLLHEALTSPPQKKVPADTEQGWRASMRRILTAQGATIGANGVITLADGANI